MTKGNREAEKKRLIEAIIGFPLTDSIKVTGTDCVLISRRDAEDLADKLIDANGVIVPPCKVGDTVFFVDKDYNKIRKAKIKGYEIKNDGYSYLDVYAGVYDNWYIRFELFNKCLFSTREEAEQALKERSE